MAKIAPLTAVIYNQDKISNLSKVVCPPYDVISASYQEELYARDPYNFIHILLSKDTPGKDKYSLAADYFNKWLEDGILIRDKARAVYFYSQQYNIAGESKTRFGFISRLRLENKKSSVFAHEHTRSAPKEDRLQLFRAVRSNLSPIFVVFPDKDGIIRRLYEQTKNEKPFMEVVDDEKTIHKIWRIDDPKTLEGIQDKTDNEKLFIADGHHRYEVSCIYRDEMIKKTGIIDPEAPFNFTLAYFTNVDPDGLTIMPIHRLVKIPPEFDAASLMGSLRKCFDIEEVISRDKMFTLLAGAKEEEHMIGMYKGRKYYCLRLKNPKLINEFSPEKSVAYRSLDVAILNHFVLSDILKLDLDPKSSIIFDNNPDVVIKGVDEGSGSVGFFLNPVKIEQIMSVALNNEKMPPKSTYFYPKVLSGLVINKHE